MKRRYEDTVSGGKVCVLIPESEEDEEEIQRLIRQGDVNDYVSFGDIRAEVEAAQALEQEEEEEET
jgi:hypothetical protein